MVSAISPTKTFLYFGMLYKKRMPGTSENVFVGALEDVSSLKGKKKEPILLWQLFHLQEGRPRQPHKG